MDNLGVGFLLGIVGSIIAGVITRKVPMLWEKFTGAVLFRSEFKDITGIDSVDKSMRDGLSPEESLKLCNNNIKFLGIAANKLVNSDDFNNAIQRCNRSGEPIQFLLSHPENPILRQAARRAGKQIDEYRRMVENTLERLRALENEHGYNIKVRLYKSESETGPPSFRLFFIDNNAVLVSYYVFGEGDGLHMPQIRITKPANDRDTKNYYFAFKHYFNSLWEQSEDYPLTEVSS